MLAVDRAFIDPAGIPMRPSYRHVIFAPSLYNSYAGSTFPGLSDLMHDIDQHPQPDTQWEEVRRHLATIIYCFQSAASVLKPVATFML